MLPPRSLLDDKAEPARKASQEVPPGAQAPRVADSGSPAPPAPAARAPAPSKPAAKSADSPKASGAADAAPKKESLAKPGSPTALDKEKENAMAAVREQAEATKRGADQALAAAPASVREGDAARKTPSGAQRQPQSVKRETTDDDRGEPLVPQRPPKRQRRKNKYRGQGRSVLGEFLQCLKHLSGGCRIPGCKYLHLGALGTQEPAK